MDGILDARLRLSPSVALRPEPFGALAYHFGNRRLTFLKRRELVSVVSGLDGTATVREVLGRCGVPEGQWAAFAGALTSLQEADMLEIVDGALAPAGVGA